MPDAVLLHHLVDESARRHGSAAAITHGDTTLSHGDLAVESRRIASWLRDRGLRRGDRLLVRCGVNAHVPALLYAASRLGAVFVVTHEQVTGRVLDHVLTDCDPAMVVTDQPGDFRGRDIPVWPVGEVLAASAQLPEADPPEPLVVDPCFLIYTSGSTALPKAVVATHQQAMFAARAIQAELRYEPADRVLCPLPLSLDLGLYHVFLGSLSCAEVVLGTPVEAISGLLVVLDRTRATVLVAVPPIAEALIRLCRRARRGVDTLRMITNTGSALSGATLVDLRALAPSASVRLMFGLTECKRVSICPPDEDLRRPGTVGRPLPGTEVLVIDEHGEPLPAGAMGELVVRGPHVTAGYWRRPELTAERFRARDGLFPELHTGDYGWLDDDGFLYFAGRRDDLYKERGFRVSGTEVEVAARYVPGVSEAVLVPPGRERLHAVLFAVTDLSGAEVLEGMRGRIEEYKIPGRCVVLGELPLLGSGKVDRAALAESAARAGGTPAREVVPHGS
ncbi:AMP-binding protein [Amycolatopsis mediterranei]|uniref:class I adenylate-forming enzyme family protein n=1 Tax=Amycolatopsis mediterranei TaxID=33910 RepID=UPI00341659FF